MQMRSKLAMTVLLPLLGIGFWGALSVSYANLTGAQRSRELIKKYHDAGKKVITVLISGRPLLVAEQINQSAAFVAASISAWFASARP